jgi:hypothetical protein
MGLPLLGPPASTVERKGVSWQNRLKQIVLYRLRVAGYADDWVFPLTGIPRLAIFRYIEQASDLGQERARLTLGPL